MKLKGWPIKWKSNPQNPEQMLTFLEVMPCTFPSYKLQTQQTSLFKQSFFCILYLKEKENLRLEAKLSVTIREGVPSNLRPMKTQISLYPYSLISLHCSHEETLHLWLSKICQVKIMIKQLKCTGYWICWEHMSEGRYVFVTPACSIPPSSCRQFMSSSI